MSEPTEQKQTPTQFFSELAKNLKAKEGVDVDLAHIVEGHILVAEPDEKAVNNARTAIIALASSRAKPTADRSDA